MCWLTSTYHAPCNHWGSRRVETPCAAAIPNSLRSGCWNPSPEIGTTRVQEFCPACLGRARLVNDRVGRTRTTDREHQLDAHANNSGLTHRDERSCSLSVSEGTANDSTTVGSYSYSDNGSVSSRTCSELSMMIEEEERVEGGNDGEFGRRFSGWVGYTTFTSRNPWTRLGGSERGQNPGTRFGGWVNYTASTGTNPWIRGGKD